MTADSGGPPSGAQSEGASTGDLGWTGGQHSALRVVLGLAAVTGFGLLLVEPSRAHAPLALVELPWLARAFGALGVAAAVAVVLGAASRSSAFVAAGLWALAFGVDLRGAWPGLFALLLLALGAFPGAPAGSLDARGRVDPTGGWRRPVWLHAALWGLLMAVTASNLADWWLTGRAAGAVGLVVALARAGGLVLCLRPGTRPGAFAALGLAELVALAPGAPVATPWSLLALAMCFEPRWIAGRSAEAHEHLFYDGNCGLCHGAVRFLAAEDSDGSRFLYAPLGGETFEALVPQERRAGLPDSMVLRRADGALLIRSNVVLYGLARLGGVWRPLGGLAALVPRPLRDLVYAGIARVRHRLFAPPPDACPLLPPALRGRFLP